MVDNLSNSPIGLAESIKNASTSLKKVNKSIELVQKAQAPLMDVSKISINQSEAKILVECIQIALNTFSSKKHFDSESMQNLQSLIAKLDKIGSAE